MNSNSGLAEVDYRRETQPMRAPFKASAGETFWVIGHRVTILPAGDGYSYLDVFSPWKAPSPPPHRHTDASEYFHVLEGRVDFTVGNEHLQVSPGECVLVPRNTIHTFRPASESGSRVITVFQPGGFDQWFRDMGVAVKEPQARELSTRQEIIQRVMRESLRYHMEIIGGG
jgi:mannose-6-phosphate isomerase-like protein (cupin superfamily)